LKNSGADLPVSVVDDLLDAWEEARQNRSTAYLNSTISADTFGWNARDLQLVEGRNASATMIARLCNLDPVWVGAGVSGSSLTYSNRTDLYRQLLDLSLTPIMKMIQDRLSMNDVTPRGHEVDFDTSSFLKSNPLEMAQIVNTLQPLGVIDRAEARRMIDLPDIIDPEMMGPA
jgi:HK97 family phage portal protein